MLHYNSNTHTHTYNVESEVAVAADVPGGVLGTAVVQAVVIRTGTGKGERPLLVVDLVALLHQLHPVLEPLARRPEWEHRRAVLARTRDDWGGGD